MTDAGTPAIPPGAGAPPWRALAGYLRQLFGRPLRKVALDPGFGCPGRCAFCLPEAFMPRNARAGGSVGEQFDRELARDPGLAQGCVAYLQAGSATFAPPARFAAVVEELLLRPAAAGLFVGTRPDCLGEEHLAALDPWRARRLLWVELGLPSASDRTLARVGRGHGAEAFVVACERTRRRGIPVCAHVILGLPGEGEHEMMATARFLARCGVEGVKLHQLQILRGTALEKEWREGRVVPLSLDGYAALAARFLAHLPASTVVHRVTANAPASHLLAPLWEGGGEAARAAVAREVLVLKGRGAGATAAGAGAPRSR